jgi:hypothetical protein
VKASRAEVDLGLSKDLLDLDSMRFIKTNLSSEKRVRGKLPFDTVVENEWLFPRSVEYTGSREEYTIKTGENSRRIEGKKKEAFSEVR